MNLKGLFAGLAILYGLLLIFLSVAPSQAISEAVQGESEILHFLQFLVFGMILFTTLHLYKVKWIYTKGLLIGLFFVVASESLQILVPSRVFSIGDIIANLLGFTLATIIFTVFRKRKSKQ